MGRVKESFGAPVRYGIVLLLVAGCSGAGGQAPAPIAAGQTATLALKVAQDFRQAGYPEEGIAVLTPVLQGRDVGAEMLVELGRLEIAAGRPGPATKALAQALARDADNVAANHMMALALDRQGQPEAARPYYERALARVPDSPAILNNLGLSLALAGEREGALAVLRRAAALPEAPSQIRANLALVDALPATAGEAAP